MTRTINGDYIPEDRMVPVMQTVCFVWGRNCVFLYLEELQGLKGYFNEPNEEQEAERETRRMEGNFRNILQNNMTGNIISPQRHPASYLTFRKVV